jgi:hypothetical protein
MVAHRHRQMRFPDWLTSYTNLKSLEEDFRSLGADYFIQWGNLLQGNAIIGLYSSRQTL